jgi:putative Holliday junction resolvase
MTSGPQCWYRRGMTGLITLGEMAAALDRRSRLLALDLGAATIGLALASWPDGVPTPIGTIRRTRFREAAAALMDTVAAERITHLVLGLPLHMGGEEGRRAQATWAFARNLQAFQPPPILLHDERLTSAEAEERMRAACLSAARQAEMIDAYAAAVILEDAIEAIRASLVHRKDA